MSYVIDGRQLNGQIGGVQRIIHEILPELDQIVKPGEYEILVPPNAENLPQYKNIEIKKYGHFTGLLWEQVCLPWYLLTRRKYGVFLCTIVPLLYPKGLANVCDIMVKTIPDIRKSIHNPIVRALLLLNYKIAVNHASLLTTISEYSKNEIVRTYRKSPDDVYVISIGWQHILKVKSDHSWRKRFPQMKEGEFFFSLSANRKQKNFKWIWELSKRYPQYIFAVAGGEDEWQKQTTYSAPNLLNLGHLSDGQVRSMMESCKAFLFPSFMEGFGLPPMEALAVGAKVIVSNTSCLPEIYGNSVHYIDPFVYDVDLDELLSCDVAPASDVLNRFGWDKSARQLADLTRKLR